MLSSSSSAFHPFVHPRPAHRLVAMADALVGMVCIDLLLLLLELYCITLLIDQISDECDSPQLCTG
jgi:hypothetical protein